MLKQFSKVASALYKINATNKDLWRQEMYTNRWKYFVTVWLYIAVCIFFIWLGFAIKEHFYFVLYWYIWEILSFIFLILGVYTMVSYLAMIIKNKKK